MAGCPDKTTMTGEAIMKEEEILRQTDRYLKGKLSPEETDRLWQAFLKHPEYYELFETEAAARIYFSRQRAQREDMKPMDEDSSSRILDQIFSSQRSWLIGSATLLAIILLVRFVAFSVTSPAPPGLWPEIPVNEMVTTEIYRDTDSSPGKLDVEINRGFKAAISGRPSEAKGIFQGVLESRPTDLQRVVATLNYGILLYNNDQFEEARKAFESIHEYSSETLTDHLSGKTWWFLAQTLARLNEDELSIHALERSIKFRGIYEKDAKQLLDWLREQGGSSPS